MTSTEGLLGYDPVCIRKKSNWSKTDSIYKFDHPEFSPEDVIEKIPHYSPKLQTLLQKIEELDSSDKKKYGKMFKHFIFSDLKSGMYGAKMLCSAFVSKGMTLGYTAEQNSDEEYEKITLLTEDELLETKYNNLYLLSSVSVYDQPITTEIKKKILSRFNQRPDNVYGELARIIIMDSGYKEGIDLFDIKYVHIFEPSVVSADQKQVIGRGTRTCGQKGLDFHPRRGWPLYVYIYDLSIPEPLQKNLMGMRTAIDLYLKAMNFDFRMFRFINELEKYSVLGSVDYELNKNVHNFSVPINDDDDDDDREQPQNIYGGGGKKLVVVNKLPITQKMGFEEMRRYINDNFSQFSWEDIKMENLCGSSKGGASTIMKYTPTQDFIRHYFTPSTEVNGMLLYHSVGTGKTCSAIASATSSFESQGYTILWVTRTTLKNDIWKNMFDQICNETIATKIREQGLEIPTDSSKRMKLLSKSWSIRPMSYKQFSNLVNKSNQLYDDLVKKNGEIDPLRKTLLIIDEAHKLYGGGDLSSIERPDMEALHKSLMNSYEISGKDSVKLLLMTATPITENPMELIKLINLCKPISEQMTVNFDEFSNIYLEPNDGTFTEEGKARYLDQIAGYISYLNRERDARQFSQPQIQMIETPIVSMDNVKKYDRKFIQQDKNDIDVKINELKDSLETEIEGYSLQKKDIDSFLKKEICDTFATTTNEIKGCDKIIKKSSTLIFKEIKAEIKDIKDSMKETINELKNQKKTLKANNIEKNAEYENYKNGPYSTITKKCAIRGITNKNKKNKKEQEAYIMEKCLQHPDVVVFDNKVEELENNIKSIETYFEIESKNKNSKIHIWEDLLTKKYISDIEREDFEEKIRNETIEHNMYIENLKKELNIQSKQIVEEIKEMYKRKEEKIKEIIKNIEKSEKEEEKNRIKEEKEKEKEAKKQMKLVEKTRKLQEKEQKKLRRTMRKNGSQLEIHPNIINILNDKKTQIIQDFQEYMMNEKAKENEKNNKKDEAQRKKEEKALEAQRKKDEAQMKKEEKAQEAQMKKEEKALEAQRKKEEKALEAQRKKEEKALEAERKKTEKAREVALRKTMKNHK